MKMALIPLEGSQPILLDKAITFIGRGPECDVVLNSSRKVSRKHCCVAQINDYYVVRDLGSMNGVRVNDRTVKTESRLKTGDELWIGDLGYRLMPAPANLRESGKKPRGKHKPAEADPAHLSQDVPLPLAEDQPESPPKKSTRKEHSGIIELTEDDILDS